MEYVSFLLLFFGFLSAVFLWNFGKKDKFLEEESNRCLNNFCKVEDNWNSEGKVYSEKIMFLKNQETKEIEIIKQVKLRDMGILK